MKNQIITEEKRKEVLLLVEKQKKAKISWLATVTGLTKDDIQTIAWDYGLIVEGDYVEKPD
jgi:hypothetical protein